jgi:phosphoglycerol transferase MdoB-like AlkP superfamily enzyme
MTMTRRILTNIVKLLLFWVLLFDFQRILFSIHNWDKLSKISTFEWLQSFVFSLRLDLATASALSAVPLLVLSVQLSLQKKWLSQLFTIIVVLEIVFLAMIHCGEINAYTEWNHKLTTRVFTHLSNPDEVFRSADYGMTIWFLLYLVIEVAFGWKIFRWLFRLQIINAARFSYRLVGASMTVFLIVGSTFFLLLRGGIQQIPLNIDSAYYSNNHVANDLSVNSLYYFSKSFLLYKKGDISKFIPSIDSLEAKSIVENLYNYPKKHPRFLFKKKNPNVVLIVLEGWSADAVSCLSSTKNSSPHFDKLAAEGLLFTNFYACGGTSEIGNSSIFSGYPALPEISISMQPEKHRKIHTLNEDLEQLGYHSNYLFSGDLKYGNIGSYFMDHGFDVVEDEKVFPTHLRRGKLNYYDIDLYSLLLSKINASKEPFLHCAFTGSTHSPYDHPKNKNQTWTGPEADYMNSLVYSDECLGQFMRDCKKQKWFDQTIFVFVSDHGHPTPSNPNPSTNKYFRIPFLIWGAPLKNEYCGVQIETIGSQSDIAATLLYQFGGDNTRYPWSKDLLNPEVPEFALHTINRGFGWISKKGNYVYHMDTKSYFENTYLPADQKKEIKKSNAFLFQFYQHYKEL